MNNYLSKDELDMIVKEPTYETIKVLYNKYNKEEIKNVEAVSLKENNEIPVAQMGTPSLISNEELPVVEVPPVSNISNINNIPNINNNVQNNMPTFEIPKIEIPEPITISNNSPNNEPVSFSGNIFEPQGLQANNLMQPTDNFTSPTQVQTTNVPVNSGRFFGGNIASEGNNPIPIYGENRQVQQPQPQTMFGQIQSNYQRAA